MTLYYKINDLNELENIIDLIKPDEYIPYFNDDNVCDFIETILHLMDIYIEENPTAISEPDFNDFIKDEIRDILHIQFEDLLYFNDEFEDEIDELLDDAVELYFLTICNSRKFDNDIICCNTDINKNVEIKIKSNENTFDNQIISEKLEYLRNIPQPTQRTSEWYIFRHNLITASNAYKAFENQSTINQLIFEKCQPLKININDEEKEKEKENDEKNKMVNTNTTLHWGQKYEPLSVMLYEYLYNTKVEDFGCIQHKKYKFIGASPDGINIDKSSNKYGRMLEIKNVVNREITGIPKKEYWIQMQLQMEVCDLDDCDFLETKFVEYDNYNSFYDDISDYNKIDIDKPTLLTKNNNRKGIIIYFHTKEGRPHYEYMPLNIITIDEINDWENSIISKYESEPYNYIFIKNIYWKLDKLSCVYVNRNKKWFEDNIKQLEKVWNTIEQERITGYEHRAPQRKIKKETTKPFVDTTNNKGCLLPIGIKKYNQIVMVDTEKLNLSNIDDNIDNKVE